MAELMRFLAEADANGNGKTDPMELAEALKAKAEEEGIPFPEGYEAELMDYIMQADGTGGGDMDGAIMADELQAVYETPELLDAPETASFSPTPTDMGHDHAAHNHSHA